MKLRKLIADIFGFTEIAKLRAQLNAAKRLLMLHHEAHSADEWGCKCKTCTAPENMALLYKVYEQ